MAEGSLYDRELAALAIKQARGDLIEAIFLVRAFRTTAPRFGRTGCETPRPPVRPGADTGTVLADLGLSGEQVAALRDAGTVA